MQPISKKTLLTAVCMLAAPSMLMAQSIIDAAEISRNELRGTARFMGMGGAFTALGGDLSTLTQNPGGIGVYRHSEIGATLDVSIQKTETLSSSKYSDSKTKVACNNFGYIGTVNLNNSGLKYINWGVAYNRVAQFENRYRGYTPGNTGGSLTNYIAAYTTRAGYTQNQLNFGSDYNPYQDSGADWLSILAYNSYLINPVSNRDDQYQGLYRNGTNADAQIEVQEKGYVDEYTFNFGGNVSDLIYWGIGVGVTDMDYTRVADYSESMENAVAYTGNGTGLISNADAGYNLYNYKKLSASGWKLSFGLIVRPVNEFRIGAAVHTPTWWSVDQQYNGTVTYAYSDPLIEDSGINNYDKPEQTDYANFSWRLKSPWRFMVGAAAVIGQNAIVSVDYERQAYNSMSLKNALYDNYGYIYDYASNDNINQQVKDIYRGANILRVGLEYRVTPKFSVRAGYNLKTSYVKKEASDGAVEIPTAGTDPSYNFNDNTQNISLGLGYRFGAFYLDGTYVNTSRDGELHAYTNYNGNIAPSYKVKYRNNSIVLSLGYRF